MKKIAPKDIDKNVIKLIGQDWMLVTAGDQEKFNMMTASWGSMGYLWNKPVVMVFVRHGCGSVMVSLISESSTSLLTMA